MYQLTVSVSTLGHLYELAGHLAELDFLSQAAATQPMEAAQPAPQTEASAQDRPQSSSNGDDRSATDRQINYLNDLASKVGWTLHMFEDAVVAIYGLEDFSHLTKPMASDLISRLQNNDLLPPSEG